jgi:hypothetical protein
LALPHLCGSCSKPVSARALRCKHCRAPLRWLKRSRKSITSSAAAKKLQRKRAEMMAFTGCSEDDVDALLAIEHGEPNAGCCKGI